MSIMSCSDALEEGLRRPLEEELSLGCHTMLPQPVQRIIWNREPMNFLLQAGHVPCKGEKLIMTLILSTSAVKIQGGIAS